MISPEKIVQGHYENFPVGSIFIPVRYRESIHLIYAFARTADDMADDGSLSPETRLFHLKQWEERFLQHVAGNGSEAFFKKLSSTMTTFDLPPQLFLDLIKAFKQDASDPMYLSFEELIEYSRYSANPVGRLLLKIFDSSTNESTMLSDHICTALQLTNFWQDISVDTGRNRFYIPHNELKQFGLEISDLRGNQKSVSFKTMLQSLVDRTKELYHRGTPLFGMVHKDLRFELKLIWHGGMRILEKIESMGYDTRLIRPVLTPVDAFLIFVRALRT